MNYDLVAFVLLILACITGSTAFIKMVDEHVENYAKDTRRGL